MELVRWAEDVETLTSLFTGRALSVDSFTFKLDALFYDALARLSPTATKALRQTIADARETELTSPCSSSFGLLPPANHCLCGTATRPQTT